MVVKTCELENGLIAGMTAIKITSIPDISIICDPHQQDEYYIKHKKILSELLTEIHGYYFDNQLYNQDINIEMIFKSVPIENQTYAAEIEIYLLIRCIGDCRQNLEDKINTYRMAFQSTLSFSKYTYQDCHEEDLMAIKNEVIRLNKQIIIKSKRIDNLQNELIPECFAFERIYPTDNDSSKILNLMMNIPNSMVSFQLIPTQLSVTEIDLLEKTTNILDIITKGIHAGSMGNMTNAIAEKHLEVYKYYENNKASALFTFNIIVYSEGLSIRNISNRLISSLSKSIVGIHNMHFDSINLPNDLIDFEEYYIQLPWVINEVILELEKTNNIWNYMQEEYIRFPYVITADEASEFFVLPYGSPQLTAGLHINKSVIEDKRYHKPVINSGDIEVGILKSSSKKSTISFSLNDLTKHMLIVGTPGSGKTTFSVSLLDRLWKDHGIPFLVIEPAKNEYRAMVDSIPDIQIFTPGKDFISPYVINPFVPPKNVRLQSYKTVLKTAFAAAVTMRTPLDKIFEETVNNCYSKFGWMDYHTVEDGGEVFNISDFVKCFQDTFENIGYVGESRNIGRAGLVRLQGLVRLFDNYHTIPVEDLLQKPTIIELAAIENEEEKALIIALLLLNILSYVNNNYLAVGELRNVILLEEAHVLLDSHSSKGEGEANPNEIAKKLLKRMLAEIRSAGVGIVIADQSPEKVTTDIVKHTNIKLAFNLVEKNDKEILAASTNMDKLLEDRLPLLRPGEAFFYMNGLEKPEEVITEDYRKKVNIRTTISDQEIAEKSTYWKGKERLLKPYPECKFNEGCMQCCDLMIRAQGKELSRRIFNEHFNMESKNLEELVKVYSTLLKRIYKLVGKDNMSNRLVTCTRIHFLRKILNETKINITKKHINESLSQ